MVTETTEQDRTTGIGANLLTFLIADVRGYTRFTNEHGDEAAARLADRFAGFCEEILGAHEGRVIELRGDEALCVFPSARNALRGAVALQGAFKQAAQDDPALPLTVGIGLDAGEAIPVRGGYRGGALNLAARLCSVAGAGEILASETVIGLARKTEGLVFVDRGQVTLKGLAAPVRVLQIASEGQIAPDLPPLQPILVTHPTNLPDDPTPFIGRDEEIGRIVSLVRSPHTRLVTLTGPGGTGKTRLALQVGNTLLHDLADGVFFCDLAPLTDPQLVPSAVASVLGVKEVAGLDLTETVAEYLLEKELLLVLDNVEHLLDAASVVASLLDACRELRILVTSRIPLHLSREQEFPVLPLAVPDPRDLPTLDQLSQYESVELFIQRARAVRPGFTVTNENAPAVAAICAHLDGLPLAIELAAARIKLFPPQALLARLDSRLKLLTGGARDKPTRQQTLRGAIDWSYGLLSEEERTLFARLSVFAGGCTFEAAEAVCNPDGELDLFEGMASLVDKSLIRQDGEDEPRFSMLETIREYAQEKLAERGDDGETIRAQHALYYTDHAGREDREDLASWLRRTRTEMDNLRSAFRWSLLHDPGRAVDVPLALEKYWDDSGRYSEHVIWLQEAIDHAQQGAPDQQALALSELASSLRMLGKVDLASQAMEQAVLLARESGNPAAIARSLAATVQIALFRDEMERAREAIEQGLPLARESGNQDLLRFFLKMSGAIAVSDGDLTSARRFLEEAWANVQYAVEDPEFAWQLSGLALLRDEVDQARAIAEKGIEAAETLGEAWFAHGHTAEMLARALIRQGELDAARGLLQRCLTVVLERGSALCPAHVLEAFARLALAESQPERAVRLLGAGSAVQRSLGMNVLPIERLLLAQTMKVAHHALDETAYAQAWDDGAAMRVDDAVAFALEAR